MVINPRVEMMPTEEKIELILQRFRKNLRWALEKSSFYKKKYNGLDIHAEDIKTLSDIRNLPVTTRDELIQASAFDLLTGPLSQTLRFNRTISGLYRGFTADDIVDTQYTHQEQNLWLNAILWEPPVSILCERNY